MKGKKTFIAMLAVAAAAVGCNKSQESGEPPAATNDSSSMSVTQQWQNVKQAATNAWQDTKEATTQTVANIKEGTSQAWSDIKESMNSTTDYTYDKKDEFVASAQADLDAMDQKIKEFSDRVANATDSAKADAQVKLQELRNQRSALNQKLDAVKNSTEADWNDVKTGFQNSYDDVKNSLKQAWQWLDDKLSS